MDLLDSGALISKVSQKETSGTETSRTKEPTTMNPDTPPRGGADPRGSPSSTYLSDSGPPPEHGRKSIQHTPRIDRLPDHPPEATSRFHDEPMFSHRTPLLSSLRLQLPGGISSQLTLPADQNEVATLAQVGCIERVSPLAMKAKCRSNWKVVTYFR